MHEPRAAMSGLGWAVPASVAVHVVLFGALAAWCWSRDAGVSVRTDAAASGATVTIHLDAERPVPDDTPTLETILVTNHAEPADAVVPTLQSAHADPTESMNELLRGQHDSSLARSSLDALEFTSPPPAAASTPPARAEPALPSGFKEAATGPTPTSGNPAPRYPEECRRKGQQGTVTLRVKVTIEGSVASLAVERTSGTAMLDNAAADAVATWRFTPAMHAGRPAESDVLVPIAFSLRR